MKDLNKIGLFFLGALIVYGGYYSAVHGIDFQTYHRVGQQILRHDFNLYPKELHALGEVKTGLYFRYAPITALLFVPFALFDMQTATFIFFLMKIAALYWIVTLVLRSIGTENTPFAKTCALAFVVGGGFLIEEFRSGNIHFLTFFLIVLSLYLVEKGRTTLPAFFLGLAITIKITPLLLVFYFGLKRKFKLCLQTLSCVALLLLAPSLLIGFKANTVLIQEWASSAMEQKEAPMNHSLKGILFKYLNENDIDDAKYGRINLVNLDRKTVQATWYVLALSILIAFTSVVCKPNAGLERRWLEYGLATTAILLLSPHSTRLYFSTLLLPFCVLVVLLLKYPGNQHAKIMKTMLGICFFVNTLTPLIMPGRKASLAYETHSPYFFASLALFFVLSYLILQFKKTESADYHI